MASNVLFGSIFLQYVLLHFFSFICVYVCIINTDISLHQCQTMHLYKSRNKNRILRKSYLSISWHLFLFIYFIILMSDSCVRIDFKKNSYSILLIFFASSFNCLRILIALSTNYLFSICLNQNKNTE